LTIRRATLEDLDAITDIYNDAILRTDATFDVSPKSLEEQRIGSQGMVLNIQYLLPRKIG